MSDIPALDRLGADLARALRTTRRRWWRAHPLLAALAAAAAIGVPAAATQMRWAELVEGETPLPAHAPAELRRTLAEDRTGWRLVTYPARLGDGGTGVCAYVTLPRMGTGRCDVEGRALLLASTGATAPVLAGLTSAAVRRVDLRLADGRSLSVAPQTAHGSSFFVVRTGTTGARLAAAAARDERGRVLQRVGPAPAPAAAVVRSPVTLEPELP